jgi:hypothetical protein
MENRNYPWAPGILKRLGIAIGAPIGFLFLVAQANVGGSDVGPLVSGRPVGLEAVQVGDALEAQERKYNGRTFSTDHLPSDLPRDLPPGVYGEHGNRFRGLQSREQWAREHGYDVDAQTTRDQSEEELHEKYNGRTFTHGSTPEDISHLPPGVYGNHEHRFRILPSREDFKEQYMERYREEYGHYPNLKS